MAVLNTKKNLAICIPSGRFVDFSFFKSFTQSIGQIMLSYNTAVFTVSSPMIFENRNEIVRRAFAFEQSNAPFKFDYMLWLDNDIVFSFDQVKKLIGHIEAGEAFVSGVYYNPLEGGIKPVAYWAKGEGYKWLDESELKGNMEVDSVGFGFCAFKAELMAKIFEKYAPRPFNIRLLDSGSLVTEDQVFCERAKEQGARIMLDASIVVKHAKGYLPH
ncbi:MAG TPA: hypothetical protein HA254_04570 [Candidatus Diapherotrites archaeon]|uniref:Glycosyltransferase family 2 protein n=1 Tax=Candidatus Iainarchaeum sp. TaxID=3101447 RepID=A0A7J4J0L4_9ARCH|nr:hypothetical protein [Candidatus Diapherotrites archaeon]